MSIEKAKEILELLNVIKSETRPIEGHTDPNAIQDCWNEVFEKFVALNEPKCKKCGDKQVIYFEPVEQNGGEEHFPPSKPCPDCTLEEGEFTKCKSKS